ncbi:MAG: hypothetical protein MZW92_16880 [Comamonadaceae bacterium]|nr:hypothetical protein [Comamonadaceae bacterium]
MDFCYERPRRGHRLRDAASTATDRVGADHHLRDAQGQGGHQGRGPGPGHPVRGVEHDRQARARGSEDDPGEGLRAGAASSAELGRRTRATASSSRWPRKLENKNRHTSFHAAGIVIGKTQLDRLRAAVPGPQDRAIVATQFTMDSLEDCGLVKMDFLGLKTLTLIKNTLDAGAASRGIDIDEDDDPRGRRGDLRACSARAGARACSSSSRAGHAGHPQAGQAQPHRGPDRPQRPVPARPDGQHPPVRRLQVRPQADRLPRIPRWSRSSKETYGVIVYQEQVMQVAQIVAGYTLGQADLLRRAMGKKKLEEMAKQKAAVRRRRAATKGIRPDARPTRSSTCWYTFAGYGFNK